jgi:hypothetical protein
MRTRLALAAAFAIVSAAAAAHADQRLGRHPDFQLMFDLSVAPAEVGGGTQYALMTRDGEPFGSVVVSGLWMTGQRCDHLRYAERWTYTLPDGTLTIEEGSGPLSLCDDDWLSLLTGQVTEATGVYADLTGTAFVSMDATFTSTVSECICSFFLGGGGGGGSD